MAQRDRPRRHLVHSFTAGYELGEMKIYILSDLEGATAVTGGWAETNPGGREFDHARKMVTGDINACARGAFEAGADDILAFDGHGMSLTVLPVELDQRVRLIQGRAFGSPGLLPGLDASFDAMIILGIHAREGTADGVMNSTAVGSSRWYLNDVEIGETGLFTALAAETGVPTIMVTGDEAVAREARELIPGVYTAAVKKGLTRYSAEIMHPARAWDLIARTTTEAIRNRDKVGWFKPAKPIRLKIDYMGNTQLVGLVARIPGVERIDGSTVAYTAESLSDCFGALLYVTSWMSG